MNTGITAEKAKKLSEDELMALPEIAKHLQNGEKKLFVFLNQSWKNSLNYHADFSREEAEAFPDSHHFQGCYDQSCFSNEIIF